MERIRFAAAALAMFFVTAGLATEACSGDSSAVVSDSGDASSNDAIATQDSALSLDGASSDGAVPSCIGPDPLVADPNGPHGIYVVEFPNDLKKDFDPPPSYLTGSPAVCGANVVAMWSSIDHGPTSDGGPQFDFSSVDALVAPWKAVGKKVNVLVWGVGFGGNSVTPKYVQDEVPMKTGCSEADPLPVFWDPKFIADYEAFVSAVVAKYGSSPDVGYVRVGLSIGAQANLNCLGQLADAGGPDGIEASFESYVSTIVGFEKNLPHTVPLMFGIGPYGMGGANGDVSLAAFEAPLAVDAGLGIGNQGLQISDVTASGSTHCNADWCKYFDAYEGQIPLYLQPVGASQPDGGAPVGSLVDILPFALSHHTQIIELWPDDLELALNPADPNYSTYGATYRTLLTQTAAVLGTQP